MTARGIFQIASLSAFAVCATKADEFSIHAFHKKALGSLVCSLCHIPESRESAELKRPGHDQCRVCHQADFDKPSRPTFCAVCHQGSGSASDLRPPSALSHAVLSDFSHAKHTDAKERIEPATGFRADCSFCHKFEGHGVRAKIPTHTECATCHSRPGIRPHLSGSITASQCRGCHAPEEIEVPITRTYGNIKFSHAAHFKVKDSYGLDCTTCHSAVQTSSRLADLSLPPMVDCIACHNTSRKIAAEFRISNCGTCHVDAVAGASPESHMLGVKPASHNESFRVHHADAAAEPGAKCFVCHQNMMPSVQAKTQCTNCHQVMRPASHTTRWKDDLHGKFAALDRTTCATCHVADYCIRCHNELPRSHLPLPLFKAGAHAQLAMLNQRACLTCHTFANTCTACHSRTR